MRNSSLKAGLIFPPALLHPSYSCFFSCIAALQYTGMDLRSIIVLAVLMGIRRSLTATIRPETAAADIPAHPNIVVDVTEEAGQVRELDQ